MIFLIKIPAWLILTLIGARINILVVLSGVEIVIVKLVILQGRWTFAPQVIESKNASHFAGLKLLIL